MRNLRAFDRVVPFVLERDELLVIANHADTGFGIRDSGLGRANPTGLCIESRIPNPESRSRQHAAAGRRLRPFRSRRSV